MINEYVDNVELKRLFEDKLLTPENTRYFYKKRGILMASQKPDDLADQAYTIFLGTTDIQELQDMMNVDGSYIQSAVFQLESTAYSPDSFIEELVDDISASKRWPDYKYTISTPTKTTDDEVTFSLQYEKVNRGSNRFQACETKRINVNLRRSDKERLLVDVRQSTTGDATKVIAYLKDLAHASSASVDDPDKFMIDFLSLEALTSRHRVDFFDKFAAEQFEDWSLKTINGISIKRGKNSENGDEEEDTEDSGEQEITGESNDLAGINQAILNGQALRSNKFVNTCIEQGFYISSMKYH